MSRRGEISHFRRRGYFSRFKWAWAAGIKCADWLSELDLGLVMNRINQLIVEQTLQRIKRVKRYSYQVIAECPQPDGSFVPPRAQAANQAAGHLAQ